MNEKAILLVEDNPDDEALTLHALDRTLESPAHQPHDSSRHF